MDDEFYKKLLSSTVCVDPITDSRTLYICIHFPNIVNYLHEIRLFLTYINIPDMTDDEIEILKFIRQCDIYTRRNDVIISKFRKPYPDMNNVLKFIKNAINNYRLNQTYFIEGYRNDTICKYLDVNIPSVFKKWYRVDIEMERNYRLCKFV